MKRWVVGAVLLVWLGGIAAAGERVALANVRKEWQNAYGAIIYTVLADVKNVSGAPIHAVTVRVELLDKHGQRVAQQEGHNARAEVLDTPQLPGNLADKLKQVKPIAPGDTDLVRISLDKADIGKPFRSVRVSVVDVQ